MEAVAMQQPLMTPRSSQSRWLLRSSRFAIACWCSGAIVLGVAQHTLAAFPAPQRSQQGMVTSAHPLASDAGVEMMRQGGNAVDAAVATTLAISVVEPFSAGIGGGGFLLLHQGQTGEIKALDFRERAPLAATGDMFVDASGKPRRNASTDGHLAVAVPGTIAGLAEVHQRYGKLPWKAVVTPAIGLAENGFEVGPQFTRAFEARRSVLQQNSAAWNAFTRQGQPYLVGDRLIQTDLAKTLRAIAQNPRNFYRGTIAQAIAQDMRQQGGLITQRDLQAYRPIWRTPLCGSFRQYQVCSMPPPSSGGVHLLQILNIVSNTNFRALGWRHPDALHLLTEAMKIAYADRATYLGDPDFVNVPVAALTSPAYAAQRRREISLKQARASKDVKAADPATLQRLQVKESDDTSHLNVVDADRNAVSLTFTVNTGFGAGVVTPGTGILLNNEMDDFASAPNTPNAYGLVGNEANAIAPSKTPLSSMTPTIVTEQGKLRLATGSPGGSRIITTVLQILINVLEYEMDVSAAVAAPRLHHQWLPDQLFVERWGLDVATIENLRQRGHQIQMAAPWGNASAIAVTDDGSLEGAADPRGGGAARGF